MRATLPAVATGQVFLWNQDEVLSYRGMANSLDGLVEAITGSEIVTG